MEYKETGRSSVSGIPCLLLHLVVLLGAVGGIIYWSAHQVPWPAVGSGVVLLGALICLGGYMNVQPNEERVLLLFGKYVGTVRETGLRWVNPFFTARKVSVRVRNFESDKLKVNDKDGNPIEIAAVVVWKVVDTAEALFHVDDYVNFVHVQSESALRNLAMPDDVAGYIAARIDSNIREIEGAITSIQSLSLVNNAPIDLELAKAAIGDRSAAFGAATNPSIQSILDAISAFYDVRLTDLLGKRRHKSITLPRQIGMWLARRHTRFSLEEIGSYFGGRDHTTVIHAIRTIETRRTDDPVRDAVDLHAGEDGHAEANAKGLSSAKSSITDRQTRRGRRFCSAG